MYTSTPPSSEVENFQIKIYYTAEDRTPGTSEPEADMLPSELARRAYLFILVNKLKIIQTPRALNY